MRLLELSCAVRLAVPLAVLACTVRASDDAALSKQIHEMTAKVRMGKTLRVRAYAAERLADLTKGADPKKIDDKTLADLVSLLSIPDDSVQFWVAASLGDLGPRARTAAPKLLEILPEADCRNSVLTSAPAIRDALKRMGVTPPPRPNCERIDG